MSELNPCECGHDINENFYIQDLWKMTFEGVAVGYCAACGRAVGFDYEIGDDIGIKAIEAWNNKLIQPTEQQKLAQTLIDEQCQ